jgi:hypothetical protein
MAVDRCWRSRDRRWLVDQVVDELGVEYRVWDAEAPRSVPPPTLLAARVPRRRPGHPAPGTPWCKMARCLLAIDT